MNKKTILEYRVKPLREAGLEAKWTKTRSGTPYIKARYAQATEAHMRERWWIVDQKMFDAMQEVGIIEAFENATLLGDVFSIRM